MILDDKAYETSHSLRTAFADGQLEMCELVIAITQRMMVEKRLTTNREKNEFENGQIDAFIAIINGCEGFLSQNKKEIYADVKYDA
jgi:hypothetical protein